MDANVSKYQTYEIETINRKEIKNAPYNPRTIDADAKKRLKEGLRKHGLVQPIVYNKRTGNLVGGHQRLSQLDVLEKNKDYNLTVAVIDVDEREEVEINIQLNNPSMGGDWDFDKLAEVAEDFELTFDDMGFSELDADLMFDADERFSKLFDTDSLQKTKGKLGEIKESRKKMNESLEKKNSVDWYTTIVFKDEEERNAFHKRISVPPYEEYVTLEQVERIR